MFSVNHSFQKVLNFIRINPDILVKIFRPIVYSLKSTAYFRLQPAVFFLLLTSCIAGSNALAQDSNKTAPAVIPPVVKSASSNQAAPPAVTEAMPPQENQYDVLSKILIPLTAVFLGGDQYPMRAMKLRMTVEQALGNLPQALKGATVQAALQYPDKIRVEAPLGDSRIIICRHGNKVWVFPGSKILPFIHGVQNALPSGSQQSMPLQLPITSQQAMLLPALFQLNSGMEMATVKGIPCRALRGNLMPEFAQATHLEDLSTTIWVTKEYLPKRIDLKRQHFAIAIIVDELTYSASLPAATWEEPKNETDVYRCGASRLQELLNVVTQPAASTLPKAN